MNCPSTFLLDIPLAVSLPHYLRSDQSFQEKIVGLHPNEDQHNSHFGLQPQFGVPMSVKIRVQLNLIVESTRFNRKIKPFDGTATPLLWVEIVSQRQVKKNGRKLSEIDIQWSCLLFLSHPQSVDGLPLYLTALYHFAFNIMPVVQTAAIYGLFVMGPLSIGLGVIGLFRRRKTRNRQGPSSATPAVSVVARRSNIVRLTMSGIGGSCAGGGGSGGRVAKEFVRYTPINISFQTKEDV